MPQPPDVPTSTPHSLYRAKTSCLTFSSCLVMSFYSFSRRCMRGLAETLRLRSLRGPSTPAIFRSSNAGHFQLSSTRPHSMDVYLLLLRRVIGCIVGLISSMRAWPFQGCELAPGYSTEDTIRMARRSGRLRAKPNAIRSPTVRSFDFVDRSRGSVSTR